MVERLGLLEFDVCRGRIFGGSCYGAAARIARNAGSAWDGSGLLDTREERT